MGDKRPLTRGKGWLSLLFPQQRFLEMRKHLFPAPKFTGMDVPATVFFLYPHIGMEHFMVYDELKVIMRNILPVQHRVDPDDIRAAVVAAEYSAPDHMSCSFAAPGDARSNR